MHSRPQFTLGLFRSMCKLLPKARLVCRALPWLNGTWDGQIHHRCCRQLLGWRWSWLRRPLRLATVFLHACARFAPQVITVFLSFSSARACGAAALSSAMVELQVNTGNGFGVPKKSQGGHSSQGYGTRSPCQQRRTVEDHSLSSHRKKNQIETLKHKSLRYLCVRFSCPVSGLRSHGGPPRSCLSRKLWAV